MEEKNTVKSVIKAINILNLFEDNDKLTFCEICKLSKLSNGTAFRMLNSLIEKHFIFKDVKNNYYTLGSKIFVLGSSFFKNMSFSKVSHDILEELAEKTLETANASIYFDNSIVFIDTVESSYSVKMNIKIGQKTNINSSASGKILLAYKDDQEINEILEKISLPKFTENTIIDKKLFKEELKNIKKLGYAIDNEEEELGMKCIAGPIFNHSKNIVGAISISGPSSRLDKNFNLLVNHVKEACGDASKRLGYFEK